MPQPVTAILPTQTVKLTMGEEKHLWLSTSGQAIMEYIFMMRPHLMGQISTLMVEQIGLQYLIMLTAQSISAPSVQIVLRRPIKGSIIRQERFRFTEHWSTCRRHGISAARIMALDLFHQTLSLLKLIASLMPTAIVLTIVQQLTRRYSTGHVLLAQRLLQSLQLQTLLALQRTQLTKNTRSMGVPQLTISKNLTVKFVLILVKHIIITRFTM